MNTLDIQQIQASEQQRTALSLKFENFEIKNVSRDGVQIGYRVLGKGPAVILIHGYPQSGYEWRMVAHELAKTYRVIIPDYRGAAGSSKPDSGYDKMTMAQDIHAVAVDAGVKTVMLQKRS